VGSAHHLDEVIIRTHWRVGVEDGVGRDTLERQLDALLDRLVIKLSHHEHGPLEGRVWHLLTVDNVNILYVNKQEKLFKYKNIHRSRV
jgi:hypothetical protein